jgi:integrase/recombinase XerC
VSKTQTYALNKNKYLLAPERERLEYLLKSHLQKDSRNAVLMLLGLYTGARAQELLNLQIEDLNSYEETVFIRGLKGSNDREIPLPNWLFRELQKIPPVENRIFPITYNRLRQIWQIYRPVNKKFHALRHSFAIYLYQKTKDIRLVQVALGHRSITNTMIYADYIYSREELKKLIV